MVHILQEVAVVVHLLQEVAVVVHILQEEAAVHLLQEVAVVVHILQEVAVVVHLLMTRIQPEKESLDGVTAGKHVVQHVGRINSYTPFLPAA